MEEASTNKAMRIQVHLNTQWSYFLLNSSCVENKMHVTHLTCQTHNSASEHNEECWLVSLLIEAAAYD